MSEKSEIRQGDIIEYVDVADCPTWDYVTPPVFEKKWIVRQIEPESPYPTVRRINVLLHGQSMDILMLSSLQDLQDKWRQGVIRVLRYSASNPASKSVEYRT